MKVDVSKAPKEGRAEFPKVDLKKDEVRRVCVLGTKGWEVTVRHYVRGLGYVHCLAAKSADDVTGLLKIEDEGGRPDECILCKKANEGGDRVGLPYRRFAVRVLRYQTDFKGALEGGKLNYWMEIWIIDNYKYRQLRGILDEWGNLNKHDLALTCREAKYQNIDIDVKKDALWVKEKDAVLEYVKEEAAKYDLMECLGITMDDEALRRKLAIVERRSAPATPVELEPEDVLKTSPEISENPFDETTTDDGQGSGEIPAATDEKEQKSVDFIDDMLKD